VSTVGGQTLGQRLGKTIILTFKVLRCAPSLCWDPLHDLSRPYRVCDQRRIHLGSYIAWRDAIDLDPSAGPFVGEGFAETEDAMFGCCIGWDGQAA